ncbi:hypothetical protein HB912_01290 [Listeria aquatica]|uniref:Bacterial Ig domain-containing protein n=1 Tax=Listeria aquatica TaxID=1494960 RepID=A0A841ZLG1_9LIST|nr:toxin Cry1Ac domain D-VI-related protein [Listeria aquatica]MBC1520278.1 hypothetical protein [Listeria aquatica]
MKICEFKKYEGEMKGGKKVGKQVKKWGKTVLAASAAVVVAVSPLTSPISVFAKEHAVKSNQMEKAEVATESEDYNRYQLLKDSQFKGFNKETLSFENWEPYYDGKKGTFEDNGSAYRLLDENGVSVNAGIELTRESLGVFVGGSSVDYIAFSQLIDKLIPNRTYTASGQFYNIESQEESTVGIMLGENFEKKDTVAVPVGPFESVTTTTDFVAQRSSERISYFLEKKEGIRMTTTFRSTNVGEKYREQWEKVDALFTNLTHEQLASDVTNNDIVQSKSQAEALPNGVIDKLGMLELISKAEALFKEREATKGVDALFTDDSHNKLKDGIKQSDIDAVKAQVDALPGSELKIELTELVMKAQSLFDGQEEVRQVVEGLFTDKSYKVLKDGVGQSDIDAAETQVGTLPTGQLKTELTNLVAKAQSLFDEQMAVRQVVEELFTDETHNQIKDSINQSDIDAAKIRVDALATSGLKTELTELVAKAKSLLDNREVAKQAVEELFTDDSHDTLKEAVGQSDIDAAKNKVDALPESEVKDELTELIAVAQNLFNVREAVKLVEGLFLTKEHDVLRDSVRQHTIDAAKTQVDTLIDDELKTELTELVVKARDLFNERETARQLVEELFVDENHDSLKEEVEQSDINAAKTKVEALPDTETKIVLTQLLAKAQSLFDEQVVIRQVDSLFTDKSHNALKEEVEQSDIDAAKTKVDALVNEELKAELTELIVKAQSLFDEREAVREATEQVDGLFTDENHEALKAEVEQSDIDEAKNIVEALPNSSAKTELLELVAKAQKLWNEQEAGKAVDALFTDATQTALKLETTQTHIDAAKAKVDNLEAGDVKTELQEVLSQAQTLFDAQEAVRTAVDSLFTDSDHEELGTGITQRDINTVRTSVEALTASPTKEEFQELVQKAQRLFDEREATKFVESLFTSSSHEELAKGVTQRDINEADRQVRELTEGTVKTELQALVQKAQQLLDEREAIEAARAAVRVLFTSDEQTELKPEVTQTQITEASSKVNRLADSAEKTTLQQLIERAQDLFDERMYGLSVPEVFNIGEDDELSGTHGKGISKVRLWVNDEVKTQATTDGNGNYTFVNANRFISSTEDKVEVVGVDVNYQEKNRVQVNLEGTSNYELGIPENIKLGQKSFSGTHGKGIAKVRLWVNGEVKTQATTDGAGNYTFTDVEKYVTSTEDQVEVVGVDGRYREVNRLNLPVVADALVKVNAYDLGEEEITGTYEAPVTKVRLWVNGEVKTQAETDAEGNFTIQNAERYVTNPKDKIEIVGVNAQYKEVTRQDLVVNVDHLVNPDAYTFGSDEVTGTYKAPVTKIRLWVNGEVATQAKTETEGQFTIEEAASYITSEDDQVEIVGVNARYNEVYRKPLSIETQK